MKKAILLISAGLLTLIGLASLGACRPVHTIQEMSQAQFTAKVQSNLIAKIQVSYPPEPPLFAQQIRGTFYETDSSGHVLLEKGIPKELTFHASIRIPDELEKRLMANTNYTVRMLNPLGVTLKRWLRLSK